MTGLTVFSSNDEGIARVSGDGAVTTGYFVEVEGKIAMVPVIYELATGDLRWLKDNGPRHVAHGGAA